MTMHDDEVATDAALVARLLSEQYPEAAGLSIRRYSSIGTVNTIYRVGDRLFVRLPRLERWAADLHNELEWLPRLAPLLSLAVPRPVFTGSPTDDFPLEWAIYEWLDGNPYSELSVDDETDAARGLATFVTELRGADPTGAPRAGRRPLVELDTATREALTASAALIDSPRAMAVWQDAMALPAWTGTPVWIHTDLLRPNVLVTDGQLSAVIDWGGAGIGDPAADVIAAWTLFGPAGRQEFRAALGVDDETWIRARGFALHQAALIIPYYRTSNPAFVATAVRTVREILADATG